VLRLAVDFSEPPCPFEDEEWMMLPIKAQMSDTRRALHSSPQGWSSRLSGSTADSPLGACTSPEGFPCDLSRV